MDGGVDVVVHIFLTSVFDGFVGRFFSGFKLKKFCHGIML